jgi:GNAT superfamily N-acetyltransferase
VTSIATAARADCAECARLLAAQLDEHGVDMPAGRLARVLEAVVADPARGFVLIAREDGRAVGVAYAATILSAEHGGPAAWLEELYVEPERRGRGVGAALLAAVLDRARALGLLAVDLEIDAGHARAASLYQRHGFRRLDRSRWVRETHA